MGPYSHDELVGLRVVQCPNWEWDTQDGGEGFVGTVIGVVGNAQNPRNVKVRWDSGKEFVYRIGAEDAYDLRVLDNSTVGLKHVGIKCQGCNTNDIAGLRWQCLNCSGFISLCTFCLTNGKHHQSHVHFRRYDLPSSDPIPVVLDKSNVQLKGIFPGALVGRGEDSIYGGEDEGSIGEVVPVPTHRGVMPGEVWVQWPGKKDNPCSYRVGFNGKGDLEMFKDGIGGHYQPHTLPVLKISRTEDKSNDTTVSLLVGDTVKFAVGLEKLRKMVVDCGLKWDDDDMEKTICDVGIIEHINKQDNTVNVKFRHSNILRVFPEKAMCRLIPWLPVGAVVQICYTKDKMLDDFGCVQRVNFDGRCVHIEFVEPDGRVVNKPIPVNELNPQYVDMSVMKKEE